MGDHARSPGAVGLFCSIYVCLCVGLFFLLRQHKKLLINYFQMMLVLLDKSAVRLVWFSTWINNGEDDGGASGFAKSNQVSNPHKSKSSQSSLSKNFKCACGVLWCSQGSANSPSCSASSSREFFWQRQRPIEEEMLELELEA